VVNGVIRQLVFPDLHRGASGSRRGKGGSCCPSLFEVVAQDAVVISRMRAFDCTR
jgi:hypothetical protein